MTEQIINILLEKLSVMMMVGFLGTTPSDEDVQRVAQQIESRKVGGILLLKRNVEKGPEVLKDLSAFLMSKMPQETGPLLVAIDGEGGKVRRLTEEDGYIELPSAKVMATKSEEEFNALLQPYIKQMKGLGINWNLAPVVDVEVETERGCIGRLERSYSRDSDVVVQFAEKVFDVHVKLGIATCFKHWPGLGADKGNTHDGMTDLTDVWDKKRDEEPFNKLISALRKRKTPQKLAAMTAHSVHRGVDAKAPSLTFSHKMIADQRAKWGVDNLFISDDLDMGALDAYEVGEKVVKAILAGNDVVILSQYRNIDPEKVDKATAYVAAVLKKNDKDAQHLKKRIEESYDRVMAFKQSWFGGRAA